MMAAIRILPLAILAALWAASAHAQTASNLKCSGCVNSGDIKNEGIKSKDIKDGEIKTADIGDGAVGESKITTDLTANGFVKAWARIASNGTIRSCWRCNTDPGETQRTGTGQYEVDFTPLGADVSDRPRMASIDLHDGAGDTGSTAATLSFNSDLSSIVVWVVDVGTKTLADEDFTIVIY